MADTFTCSACGETFPKAWSDEEAMVESRAIFGTVESLAVVCDDCFEAMNRRFGFKEQE